MGIDRKQITEPTRCKIKKAAHFPNLVLEVPKRLLEELKLKEGMECTVSLQEEKSGNKLIIYEFKG
jgi:antitoxin component of MazEF toxin-antitoxin module